MGELSPTIWQFGIAGIAMIIVFKALDLLKMWWLTRNGKTGNGAVYMTKLQCMTDPQHFERQKQSHKMIEWLFGYSKDNEPAMKLIRSGVGSGAFACAWNRDEVLRMIIAMEDNTKALTELTKEIRKQNGRN